MKDVTQGTLITGEDTKPGALELQPLAPGQSPSEITPLYLVNRALELGHVDQMEKLMALYERWEAGEARKAFTKAMSAFKSNAPVIVKNKHVTFPTKSSGQMDYWHATLDNVVEQIAKGLGPHGLSHRWRTEQLDGGLITVTCIITHERGHFEETTLRGPKDDSAGKNPLQTIGSTITYLERYTLMAATGLAAKGQDSDGRGAPAAATTEDDTDWGERIEWIGNCRTKEELGKIFFPAYEKARTLNLKDVMQALIGAKRRKEQEWA